MLDLVHKSQPDGTLRSYCRMSAAQQQQFPKFVVVELRGALMTLDALAHNSDFPTMDVDAILQATIEGLFFPADSHRSYHNALKEILQEILFDKHLCFHDGLVNRTELERALLIVLELTQQTLQQAGLYALDGMLAYDYLQRRGPYAIVLQRRDLLPLD